MMLQRYAKIMEKHRWGVGYLSFPTATININIDFIKIYMPIFNFFSKKFGF